MVETPEVVVIWYTNYRGERALRRIQPRRLRFDSSPWHPEKQWLLDALDVEKNAERSFAVKDIESWTPAEEYDSHRAAS